MKNERLSYKKVIFIICLLFQKIKEKISIQLFLAVYFIILMVNIGAFSPRPSGEWDDYLLPAVSIINERNFGVGPSDVELAKKIFPEFEIHIDNYKLSKYINRNGEEMAWYFPTYSLACVPMILLFLLLKIPAIYAFGYTNLLVLFTSLQYTLKKAGINDKRKWLLITLLSVNPIIFYLPWISAEVFIYACMIVGILCWVKKEYKKAAFFVSLASTLNPVILGIGFIMIAEYFIDLGQQSPAKNVAAYLKHFISHWKDIIRYGLCYTIGLVPLVYNLYHIGHINLTASIPYFLASDTPTWARFLAYMFDMNFGILPYYNFVFVLSFLLIFISVLKHKWKYIAMMAAFYIVAFLYSIMKHINCGMSGISRYNAWNSVTLIFAVIIVGGDLLETKKWFRKVFCCGVVTSVLCSAIIVYQYGPMWAQDVNYKHMTPIASAVLEVAPGLYSPLVSTFNSRVNHIDGGYEIETPIIYTNNKNEVKKIFATDKDKDILLQILDDSVEEIDFQWYEAQLQSLDTSGKYISIPPTHVIPAIPSYNLGETITFSGEKRTAEAYVFQGLSVNEELFSWSDGDSLIMKFWIRRFETEKAHAAFRLRGIFGTCQTVNVMINGINIEEKILTDEYNLEFDFEIPQDGIITLELSFPDAVSPLDLGISNDDRKLSIALVDLTIQEKSE